MNKRVAERLKRRIWRESTTCIPHEIRRWGRGIYDLVVFDTVGGYSFIVPCPAVWDQRVAYTEDIEREFKEMEVR